ncbi:MAG: Cytochrome c-type biogenesis protein CcmE [Methanonatronarchaeales archaeon]|nr:Cytochrome c-type biogenesis protein CcmE [Methanonatronarchaeales archaeon]
MERRRAKLLVGVVVAVFLAGLRYVSLDDVVTPYRSPGELVSMETGEWVQVIGNVQDFTRDDGITTFRVISGGESVGVRYDGELPPMFSPSGDVVVRGTVTEEGPEGFRIVTKCPSRYEPGD